MLSFWNPQDIKNEFRGDSKLPDYHQEDQEAQGHNCPQLFTITHNYP